MRVQLLVLVNTSTVEGMDGGDVAVAPPNKVGSREGCVPYSDNDV